MKKEVIFLIFILCLMGLVSANFDVGDSSHSIQTSYGPSTNIKGWINISLDNEPSNSMFKDGENNSISLIDLINQNPLFEKNCNPQNCESDYTASNGQNVKNFNLNEDEYKIFGLKFTGDVSNLLDISFDLTSNNPESVNLPLAIDILNDGQIEWQANVASNNFGPENFGCFKDLGDTSLGYITQISYCEKMIISRTPDVELGAYVKGIGSVNFDMSIKKKGDIYGEDCIATASGIGGIERISCDSDFQVKEKGEYVVCIKTKNSGDNNKYQIAYETNEPCGFTGTSGTYSNDFEIFSRPKKYASSISLTLDDDELGKGSTYIEDYIESYLIDKYGGDCSRGCAIPIKIISGVNQEISLSNLNGFYLKNDISTPIDQLYDVSETPATINANFQKLNLDKGNFIVPDEYGEHTFTLNLNEDEIFSEEINVEKVPEIENLKPRTTAVNYPTKFNVSVELGTNITKYEWNFGDNETETTIINQASHTYKKIGNYNITITITDSSERISSKTFDISVGSAKIIVNELLVKDINSLSNVMKQMDSFPSFDKKSISAIIDLDLIEEKLEEIQQDNATASSESDYGPILEKLLELEIPESVSASISSDSLAFYSDVSNINLDVLKSIGGGDYSPSEGEEYRLSVLAWNEKNLDTKISFQEYTAIYGEFEKSLLKVFKLNINNKNYTTNPYFIIQQIDNLNFDKDYSEQEESGYVYISLTDEKTDISFSTTEDINFISLPMFISPSISELSIEEIITERDQQLFRLALLILILFLLAIIGFVIYLLLHAWYKKKYEDYLFKNKNSLYNLISYVQSSKKKNMKEKDIIGSLKKSGWKSEQINYIMKKYYGKRTGMPEIPVGKILEKLKKKQKISTEKPIQKNSQTDFNSDYKKRI